MKIFEVKTEEIPFNSWSRERILAGRKSCTSRHRKYNDLLVYDVFQVNWGSIKSQDWKTEGADSPEELQKVIESIYHRPVLDDELFYLHLFDNKKMQERLRR